MMLKLHDLTLDGKYQSLLLFLMDINDLLGRPFEIEVSHNVVIKNFTIDTTKWDENSTKYIFFQQIMFMVEDTSLLEM